MKTTLEMPDDLMRRIEIRAAERNEKLEDTIAQLLEAGMAAGHEDRAAPRPPRPVKLEKRALPTIDDIEAAIAAGRS